MYQHSKTKKNGKLERLLHSLNGYHYRKTLSKLSRGFLCIPLYYSRMSYCNIPALLLSQENAQSAQLKQEWAAGEWDHLTEFLTAGRSCSLASSAGLPRFPALPHSLLSTGLWIPPKQMETGPTPTFLSHSHQWSPKGELLLIQPNARKIHVGFPWIPI